MPPILNDRGSGADRSSCSHKRKNIASAHPKGYENVVEVQGATWVIQKGKRTSGNNQAMIDAI